MVDVAMCQNEKCSDKNNCYRYLAKPSLWQSYGLFNHNSCEYFIDVNIRGKEWWGIE